MAGNQPVMRVIRPVRPIVLKKVREAIALKNDLLDDLPGFGIPSSLAVERTGKYCEITCTYGYCNAEVEGKGIAHCGCKEDGSPVCWTSGERSGPQESTREQRYEGFARIYDPSGRLVWQGYLKGNLPSLKRGVYFVRTPHGTRRIVVK